MFRALLLLIFLTGTSTHVTKPTEISSFEKTNLIQVNNFQVVPKAQDFTENNLSAESVLAIDLDSHIPLYQKNTEKKLPIASLAKLMTALIILEENQLNEIVTISGGVNETEGSRIWLYAGEEITVENLLKGMLIQSGNDAAYELAKFNAGSLQEFSKKMNQKAQTLGLKNSHFLDPAGLDDVNNYSTVSDLALISTHVLKNDFIRKIVSMRETSIFSTDGKLEHRLKNTNKMLEELMGAKGLKTGTTETAGECLITLIEVNHNDILILILNSTDRYQDTKIIYNYLNNTSA